MTAAPSKCAGAPQASPICDDDAVRLLRRMVDTSSVSGDEHALATLLASEMSRCGFSAEIDQAGNAIGWIGPRHPDRLIALLGHMDTVPGIFPVRIEGDLLYGRGAVDAKGPLATFIVAASRASLPPGVAIAVIGAVEEETPTSRGARAIIHRFRPSACVIGEPSGWSGVTIGYKGRLVCELTIQRDLSHTAGPSGSAADEVFSFWNRVRALVDHLNHARSGAFETIQASLRELRTSSDGLQEHASLVAGFRLPPQMSPQSLERQIRPLATLGQLALFGHESAHVSPRDNAVARHLAMSVRREGARPSVRVKTGTSDMNVVAPHWKCPIAAFGPGDSALDHTPNEHISLGEFLRATRVLTNAIESLSCELAAGPVATPNPPIIPEPFKES